MAFNEQLARQYSNVVANGNFDPLQLSCQMRLFNFSMWFWSFTYLMNINNFSWNVCLCVWYSQGKLLWLVFSHLHGGFAQSFPKKSSPSQVELYAKIFHLKLVSLRQVNPTMGGGGMETLVSQSWLILKTKTTPQSRLSFCKSPPSTQHPSHHHL